MSPGAMSRTPSYTNVLYSLRHWCTRVLSTLILPALVEAFLTLLLATLVLSRFLDILLVFQRFGGGRIHFRLENRSNSYHRRARTGCTALHRPLFTNTIRTPQCKHCLENNHKHIHKHNHITKPQLLNKLPVKKRIVLWHIDKMQHMSNVSLTVARFMRNCKVCTCISRSRSFFCPKIQRLNPTLPRPARRQNGYYQRINHVVTIHGTILNQFDGCCSISLQVETCRATCFRSESGGVRRLRQTHVIQRLYDPLELLPSARIPKRSLVPLQFPQQEFTNSQGRIIHKCPKGHSISAPLGSLGATGVKGISCSLQFFSCCLIVSGSCCNLVVGRAV